MDLLVLKIIYFGLALLCILQINKAKAHHCILSKWHVLAAKYFFTATFSSQVLAIVIYDR